MTGRSPQECRFRLSVAVLTALGLGVLGWAVAGLRPEVVGQLGLGFWLVTVLVVVGELRPIITPGAAAPNGLATSTAFVVAVLLHRGLALALLLHVVATVIADGLRRRTSWRTAFAIAQRALSLGAAALVLDRFGLLASADRPVVPTGADLPVLVLAAAAYFAVDDLLVCGVVRRVQGRVRGRGLRRALTEDLGYDVVTTGALLALSPLLAVVMAGAPGLLPLFVLPLAAVYSTAKVSLDRDRQAHHDPLTGLPNRALLVRRVDDAVAAADPGGRVALIVLDLDRFKEVNDTLGHPTGDRLLQVAAVRLSRVLRPGDTVARLGGDEFAIVLPRVSGAEAACEVGRRVRAALAAPFHLDGLLLELDASVGVAVHPEHGADFAQLLQRADVAMYLAKEGRTGVELYVAGETGGTGNSVDRLALLGELRGALDRDEIELRYQPTASLSDGRVLDVEALVRWRHPTRGLLAAPAFVPLAEQSGLIRELTRHVVDLALADVGTWWQAGRKVPVTVNVSARDLQDRDLVDFLADRLAHHRLPPAALLLEVTEGTLRAHPARVERPTRLLRGLGIGLVVDEFGLGSFSLRQLRRLPIREIKIARALVARMSSDEEDADIGRSIIELGAALGVRVVAEGVETAADWGLLATLGCDGAQGGFLCDPLPGPAATAWLAEHATAPVATVETSTQLPRQLARDVEPA